MADFSNRIRELGALTRQRRQTAKAITAARSPAAVPHGLALAIGTRVLDLITGEEGVIVDGTVQHIIVNGAGGPAR